MIARFKGEWEDEYQRWQKRNLSARRYVYVWADGVYLQARMEPQAECMLVLIGATPEGKKDLIGFQTGLRESAQPPGSDPGVEGIARRFEGARFGRSAGSRCRSQVYAGCASLPAMARPASGKLSTRPSRQRATNAAGCTRR